MSNCSLSRRKYLCAECSRSANPKQAQKCPGCRKLKAADWYQKNKAKVRQWSKAWRDQNRAAYGESQKEYNARYRKEHAAERRALNKAWQQANPQKVHEKHRLWRKRHPDVLQAQKQRAFSRKAYGEYWEAHRTLLNLNKEIKNG